MTEPYYRDEQVTLYLGDCREVTAWLAADVLVTDPPYGIGWSIGFNRKSGTRAHGGIQNDHDTSTRDAALAAWGERPAVVFGAFAAPEPPGRVQTLVWWKPPDAGVVGSVTGYKRDIEPVFLCGKWPKLTAQWSSVIRCAAPMIGGAAGPAGRTGHPHTKPLDVMETLISRCPAGVIADPFAGSGSTLVAARNLGRQAIGVELVEEYAEVIAKRLDQMCLPLGAP